MLSKPAERVCWTRAFLVAAIVATAGSACSTEAKIERHLERGEQYFAEGKYQEAIIEYLNVLQLDESNQEATERLAIAFYNVGQLGPAYRYLQRAAEFDPENTDVRVKLGTVYLYGGRQEEAREEASAVIDSDPTNLDALAIYASTASTEGEIDGAIRRLESARAEHEDRAKFYLSLGSLHLRKGDVTTAETLFQEAARREPDSHEAHLALGIFYAAKRELVQAEAEFNEAARVAPIRSGAQIRVVDFYRMLGKPELSRERLRDIVEEAPDFLPAWQRVASYSFADQDYDRAEEALKHLLEANPRDPESLRVMGEVHRARGENEAARERFREAVAVLQDFVQRRPEQASAHFRLAQLHVRLGEIAQAKTVLQTTLELAPNSPSAQLLLSELNIRTGQTSDAIRTLEELVSRQPSAMAFELLGTAYMQERNFERAGQAFERFVELAPENAKASHLLGAALVAQGKQKEAEERLQEALRLDPAYLEPLAVLATLDAREARLGRALDRVRAQMKEIEPTGRHYYLLGQLYRASNQTDKAEEVYRKAVERDTALTAAYAQLAGIYVRTERHHEAIQEMERGLQVNPENVPVMMLKGMLQHQIGQIGEAQGTYEKLLGLNPRFAPAANNLAYIYQGQEGKLDRALELAEIAREEAPDNPDIADTLGWILYKRGTYERALGLLKEAASQRPEQAEIWYHLGFAHHKLGELDETNETLGKALELDPDHQLAGEARTILDEMR